MIDSVLFRCAELGRYAFLLTIAPPQRGGATGNAREPGAPF